MRTESAEQEMSDDAFEIARRNPFAGLTTIHITAEFTNERAKKYITNQAETTAQQRLYQLTSESESD